MPGGCVPTPLLPQCMAPLLDGPGVPAAEELKRFKIHPKKKN